MTTSLHIGVVLATIGLFACSDDAEPALTDATSLTCPTPGDLPFRLESSGFQRGENRALAESDQRNKDEASDVLGNPSGAVATVYLTDDEAVAPGPIVYAGTKARTMAAQGLFANALPGEYVSLWHHDASGWSMLDRGMTDDNGAYALSGGAVPNGEPIYSMLEADGSCAEHHDFLLPSGSAVVVMDIDGTLTTSDSELLMQITDENYVPAMMTSANVLAQHWAAKGYPIVYLTARGHVFDSETRAWLAMLDFPAGALITTNGGSGADVYKTAWLERMIGTFGWTVTAAYGNAVTDIAAYANAAIPLDRTFIIGPEAGMGGTVAIPNGDYTAHIAAFVDAQPENH